MSEASRERSRRYRERHREELREEARRYREANPDKVLESGRRYRETHREKLRQDGRQYGMTEAARGNLRRYRDRVRATVFGHYSETDPPSCACPGGCRATKDLTIDHTGGNGKEHRKDLGHTGAGVRFYIWLINQGLPEGYQVLCRQCNSSKSRDGDCVLWHD
jgi:hypothetical protein